MMRVIRRSTEAGIGLFAALIAIAALASPVAAVPPGNGVLDVEARTVNYTPGYGGSCSYTRVDPADWYMTADAAQRGADRARDAAARQGMPFTSFDSTQQPDGTYVWQATGPVMDYQVYSVNCGGGSNFVWVPNWAAPNLANGAYQRLIRLLPDPTIGFQPVDATFGWLYTQVPTDFRLDPTDWRAFEVTARAGPAWATARADPNRLIFRSGDPQAVTPEVSCNFPRATYDPANPGDCSYQYLNASSISGGRFSYEVEIVWDVTLTDSRGGPAVFQVHTTDDGGVVRVAEARPSS